jgi:hypothetical protein
MGFGRGFVVFCRVFFAGVFPWVFVVARWDCFVDAKLHNNQENSKRAKLLRLPEYVFSNVHWSLVHSKIGIGLSNLHERKKYKLTLSQL